MGHKTMHENEKAQPDFDYEPAKIVQIAYRQLSEMSGLEDPCSKSLMNDSAADGSTFVCTRRLLQLPIFATVTSTVSNVYNTVKQSNEVVGSILESTEEGLEQGVKLVEPVTLKIGTTLETPLKCVDNVLCKGLDYLEQKVPSITATSGVFLTNIGQFFRSSMDTLTLFYMNAVKSIRHLSGPMAIEDSNENEQKTRKN